ncbi:MAG: hypothetical protein IJ404_05630 [Clostridia bacterium]|nr:hypothetical protein [Clostridia bacterium]
MVTFMLFELIILLEFLPATLALICGFKMLWLLPFIAAAWIALVRAFMREEKKKARRVRADGRSEKINFAENIIPNVNAVCQDGNYSRSEKQRKEVYIYE